MKYGTPLNMDIIESRTIVLNWIKPNSTVLEFGCAYGQMTQYMKQQLNCKVYIVEYFKESFQSAIQYAEDGVCGDILDYTWKDKYKNIKFDYILYTDVLEHLLHPLDVFEASTQLLKDNGEILLSVPNIAHNDIIYKLVQGKFEYTSEGLLDETHIHFFSKESIEKMLILAKCFVKEWRYTEAKTGYTEQFRGNLDLNSEWWNMLHERKGGEIYQFVIRVGKILGNKAEQSVECKLPDCCFEGKVYYDLGEGFEENKKLFVKTKLIDNNTYQCEDKVTINDTIIQFRYDMIEKQSCYLQALCIKIESQSGEEKQLFTLDNPLYIKGNDPYVYIPLKADKGDILCIFSTFVVEGSSMLLKLADDISKSKDEIMKCKGEIARYQNICTDLRLTISNVLSNQVINSERCMDSDLKMKKVIYENEKLIYEKEKLEEEMQRLSMRLQENEKQLSKYEHSLSWKVTKPLRDIWHIIKK